MELTTCPFLIILIETNFSGGQHINLPHVLAAHFHSRATISFDGLFNSSDAISDWSSPDFICKNENE